MEVYIHDVTEVGSLSPCRYVCIDNHVRAI